MIIFGTVFKFLFAKTAVGSYETYNVAAHEKSLDRVSFPGLSYNILPIDKPSKNPG